MTPSSRDLIRSIGKVLRRTGTAYATSGSRDVHYAIWVFSMAVDEAMLVGEVDLFGLQPGPCARFRKNPSDLEDPPSYTAARVLGPRRVWEAHVDVNILGASGAAHGVDVSIVPAESARRARRLGSAPRLTGSGLGIEAKCFGSVPLTPNEARVSLGFQVEVEGPFWLVSNKSNAVVRTMLRAPGRKTDFFGEVTPGAAAETELRAALNAQLCR